MSKYLRDIKDLTERLAASGDRLSEENYTLRGLLIECCGFKSAIKARGSPITFYGLSSLLESKELNITHDLNTYIVSDAKALATQMRSMNLNIAFNPKIRGFSSNFYRGGRSGFCESRGRGRSTGGRVNRGLACHICGYSNHVAANCYHRFNPNYQKPQSQPQAHFMNSHNLTLVSSTFPHSNPPLLPTPSSLTTSHHTPSKPHWFFDTCASHHVLNSSSLTTKFNLIMVKTISLLEMVLTFLSKTRVQVYYPYLLLIYPYRMYFMFLIFLITLFLSLN